MCNQSSSDSTLKENKILEDSATNTTINDEEISFNMDDSETIKHMTQQQLVKVVEAYFQGPIPHPSILKGYEKVLPGAADRILSMTEEQARHRRKVEADLVNIEKRDSLLGIIGAFIISVLIIVCGTVIIIKVPSIAGIIAGSLLNLVGIGSIIRTFLRGPSHSWHGGDEANKENKE